MRNGLLVRSKITTLLVIGFAATLIAISGAFIYAFISNQSASAISGSDFNPGRIIDDEVFYNGSSMNESQIQNFLNSKVPSCDTNGQKLSEFGGPDLNDDGKVQRWEWGKQYYNQTTFPCLRDYKQNTPQMEAASGLCGGIPAKNNQSSAQIITAVSTACNISPKVLIVLLEKEQSLVTDTWPLNRQYRSATGFDCPDTAPCDPSFAGFFYQVYHAARQFNVYKAFPNSYNYVAGRTNKIYWQTNLGEFVNPTGNESDPSRKSPGAPCGYSNVFIENQATAALYIYTPYRPNQKALANLNGTGDACSAYGNRNFWRLFTQWFGTTKGTPFFKLSGSGRVYISGENNSYYYVPSPSILASYGYGTKVNRIDTYSSSYISGKTYAGHLKTTARFEDSKVYLVDSGSYNHISSRDLMSDFGFTMGEEAMLPKSHLSYLKQGPSLQNIARDTSNGRVYLIEDGRSRHLIGKESYDSGDPRFSDLPFSNLSHGLITSLKPGPIIYPYGIAIKSSTSPKVYFTINKDEIVYISSQELLQGIGFSNATVRIIPDNQINSYIRSPKTLSTFVIGKENNSIYLIDANRNIYLVSESLAGESGFNISTANLIMVDRSIREKYNANQNIGNLVRAIGSDEVYLVENGLKRHVKSRTALASLGRSMDEVVDISSHTINLLPTGTSVK